MGHSQVLMGICPTPPSEQVQTLWLRWGEALPGTKVTMVTELLFAQPVMRYKPCGLLRSWLVRFGSNRMKDSLPVVLNEDTWLLTWYSLLLPGAEAHWLWCCECSVFSLTRWWHLRQKRYKPIQYSRFLKYFDRIVSVWCKASDCHSSATFYGIMTFFTQTTH